MNYIRIVIPLLIVYLALTLNLAWNNILVGVLIATFVAILLRPKINPMNLRQLPIALVALFRYTIILVIDMLLSGLQVAMIVLSPRMPIQPGIIAIPPMSESELSVALSAHAITVTPGEIVIEIGEDGTMYTHCLIATDSEKKAAEAQKLRINLLQNIIP